MKSEWNLSIPNGTINDLPNSFTVSLQVIILIVMLLGIGGNALTIIAICKFKRLRTAGNALIVNLSVSDLLYLMLILPIRFGTFHHRSWRWDDTLCLFVGAGGHFFLGMSTFSQAMIALNRFLHIVYSTRYKTLYTKRYMTLMLIFMWLALMFLTIILPCAEIWGYYSYKKRAMSCTFDRKRGKGYQFMLLSVGTFFPLLMIIICYSTILIYVRASQKKVQGWSTRSRNPTLNFGYTEGEIAGKSQVKPAEVRKGQTAEQSSGNVLLKEINRKSSLPESLTSSSLTDDKNRLLKNRGSTNTGKLDIELEEVDDEVFNTTEQELEIETKKGTKRKKRISTVTTTILLEKSNYVETKEFTAETQTESFLLKHTSISQDVKMKKENNTIQENRKRMLIKESEKGRSGALPFTAKQGGTGSMSPSTNQKEHQSPCLSKMGEEIPNSGQRNTDRLESLNSKFVIIRQNSGQTALLQRHDREACKITLMMGMIFIIYLLCTMPYFVINIAVTDVDQHALGYLITLMMAWLDSCLNPIIYAIMNTNFKTAYKDLLTRSPCFNTETNSALEQSVGN